MAETTSVRIPRFASFAEFWPFYLSEHSHPLNRRLHFIGTTGFFLSIIALIVTGNLWFLLAMPLVGYGFAWVGHFLVEHNRPATFKHPVWSFMGDMRMYVWILTGRLK